MNIDFNKAPPRKLFLIERQGDKYIQYPLLTHSSLPCKSDHDRIEGINDSQQNIPEISKKFINFCQFSPNALVNLEEYAKKMKMKTEMILDIANTLEGLKTMFRRSKYLYEWRGLSKMHKFIQIIEVI